MKTRPGGFWKRVKEIDMFFAGTDPVHQTMRRVVEKLEGANIPYAIVGGMAVNAHRYQRTTADVDVLLTPEGSPHSGGSSSKQITSPYRRGISVSWTGPTG